MGIQEYHTFYDYMKQANLTASEEDYIEMIYACVGLGSEQLSQEKIDEIRHKISELSDEKKQAVFSCYEK